MKMDDQIANDRIAAPKWKSLYTISSAAALIAALIFRRWLGAEFIFLRSIGIIRFGPTTEPGSVIDWFTLLQTHRLIGLTLLNFFDIVNYALVGLIFIGLYAALERADKSFMTLAMALGFAGMSVYFASNQAFAMLSLSDQYAAATTDAQRSMFLAAGQALLTMNNFIQGGSGIVTSFLLVNLAGLIISIVMAASSIFSKGTAYVGILAHGFGLGVIIPLAFAPPLTFIPLSASAPFLLIWYILISLRLFQMSRAS
jgi:hypothetical protein